MTNVQSPIALLAREAVKQARCWEGYEPVPGKEPYSEDSCRPKGSGKKKEKKAESCGCGGPKDACTCDSGPDDSDQSEAAKLARAMAKQAWEVGDDTGSYSDKPLRYASHLTGLPRVPHKHPDYDREVVARTLRQAVKKLPDDQKLHWIDLDAVVGERPWYNPMRYLDRKQIIGEKYYELGRDSDDKAHADIVQQILDNYEGLNSLISHYPARYWETEDDSSPIQKIARLAVKQAAPMALDPKFLQLLEAQLDRMDFDADTPFAERGDDLDLIETIMEYEAANNGDIDDRKINAYTKKRDNLGFPVIRPEFTFGQLQDRLQKNLKPRPLANPSIQKIARLAVKQAEGAWTREEGQSDSGGLNAKGRASLKAQGHDIKPPVTESNPKGERAGRKASFCARMGGMKKKLTSSETANDPDSRINKALRKWNC